MGNTFMKVLPMSPNGCNLCPKTKQFKEGRLFFQHTYLELKLNYTSPTIINTKAKKTAEYYNKLSPKYDKQYSAYLHHTHEHFLRHFNPQPGDRILDASAGTGILAEKILENFTSIKELVLNDPATKMLEKAKVKLTGYSNVRFTNCYCEELNFEHHTFDKIICLNSFHYYVDQKEVLTHFHNFLKPGGELYMLDWNRKGFFLLPNFLIGLLSPENINSRSLEEMNPLLKESGFTIQKREEWNYRFWKFFFVKSVKIQESETIPEQTGR